MISPLERRGARWGRGSGWGLGEAFGAWVTARVVFGLGFAAASGTRSVLKLHGMIHLDQKLVTWDGTFYRTIAQHGYGASPRASLRFFPLYPLAARVLAWPLGNRVTITLVVLANAAAFASLVLLRKLVEEETGDDDLARRSMWLLAIFPAGAAMIMAYSEPLMLLLTLGMFLAVRRKHWWLAAVLGVLAGLTRPVAVLLAVPFAVEGLRGWRQVSAGQRLARVAATVSPAAGTLLYLFWTGGTFGNWLEPVRDQSKLRAGFQDPFTRLWDTFRLVVTKSQLAAPDLAFTVVFIVLLVVAIRTQRLSWWTYAAVTLITGLSAHNISSMGRYGLMAFPFAVALARVTEDERLAWPVFAVSAAGLAALTAMSYLGVYQP